MEQRRPDTEENPTTALRVLQKTGLHASWQVPSDHDAHHAWSENPCRVIREKLQAARNQFPHGLLNT